MSATTFDADTDFTVGGTVITDGRVQDDGILALDAVTYVQVRGAAGGGAAYLIVGDNDSDAGVIQAVGGGNPDDQGGKIFLNTSDEHDGTINSYNIDVVQDDFRIGPSTDTDSLQYSGANDAWTFSSSQVNITKTGGAGVDSILTVGADDSQRADLRLYGDTTSSVDGAIIRIYTAADHDTTIGNYQIRTNEDDLLIGPVTDTNALIYNGGSTRFEFTSGSGPVLFSNGLRVKHAVTNVASPPTDANLDTAFGTPAAVGSGFVATLDDNAAGTAMYLVASDGTNWWHSLMTKAV
jgi:hypothetical protein